MSYISYRDAFNQLGNVIFKGSWTGKELSNASLYDAHHILAKVVKSIIQQVQASSDNIMNGKKEITKKIKEIDLQLIKEINISIDSIKKRIKENKEDIVKLKEQCDNLQEYFKEWEQNEDKNRLGTDDILKIDRQQPVLHREVRAERMVEIRRIRQRLVNGCFNIKETIEHSQELQFVHLGKFLLPYDYERVFSRENQYRISWGHIKHFVEFFNTIYNGKDIERNEKEEKDKLQSLLRYTLVSYCFISRQCELYYEEGDIVGSKKVSLYSHKETRDFISNFTCAHNTQQRELSQAKFFFYYYKYTSCYERAGFTLGKTGSYKDIKKGCFDKMLKEWMPEGKVGRIEKYLRKELGYYPPYLELMVRAIVDLKITDTNQKGRKELEEWFNATEGLDNLMQVKNKTLFEILTKIIANIRKAGNPRKKID